MIGNAIDGPSVIIPEVYAPHHLTKFWDSIHSYAPQNQKTWDAEAARAWISKWRESLLMSNCGCGNTQDFKLPHIKKDSPEGWFESVHRFHNQINAKLNKRKILLSDAYASYWPERYTPQKPNLVITVATGPARQHLDITRPSLAGYAEKIGADFIALENRTSDWWGDEKFRVHQFVKKYRRTIFVDCDVVISPDCPDLFGVVPADAVGMHDDLPHLKTIDWLKTEREAVFKSQNLPCGAMKSCLNSGVVICSSFHDIWQAPSRPLPETHCAEQLWVEYQAGDYEIFSLDTKFNTQWWMNKFNDLKRNCFVLHLSNSPTKKQGLNDAMRNYYYCYNPENGQ